MPVPRKATNAGRGGSRGGRGQSCRISGPPRKVSNDQTNAGGVLPPLSDVGVGGGSVEDGTAWSMIARFVCSVPGCGATFSKKQNLQRHQSQKHGRQKQSLKQMPGGGSSGGGGAFNEMETDEDLNEYDDEGGYM